MADDTDTSGVTGSTGAPARPAANQVPREKPVIEGQAEEIAADAPSGASAPPPRAADVPAEEPLAFPSPPPASVAPAERMPDAPPPRTHAHLWPFAAAIVIAALIAVGGALVLNRLDRTPANLAALESLVATLQHRAASSAAPNATQAVLEKRMAALEAANGDMRAMVAGLRGDLDKLAAEKAAPAQGAAPDLAPLEARLGGLERKLAALDTKVGALADQLNAENGRVSASETRVSQSAAARADSEAIAILAANLLRKVDAGAPYETDLAALANRGLDKSKLAPLEPTAASGVATPAALAKQFSDLSPAILSAEPQPKENGFLDHLVKGAERLVRVRKIGETPGDDLSGRLARIKAALDAREVETGYQEWSGLPDVAKTRSEAFGEAAKARIDAIAAARSIDSDAVVALGKARS